MHDLRALTGYSNRKAFLIGALAVVCACLPLFDLRSIFAVDWTNGVWMANYSAAYFRSHLSFPATINTNELVGMAYPTFYGYLFFPVLAVFSTIFDANIILRLGALLVLAAQFFAVFKVIRSYSGQPWLALAVGTLVTWSIYPLTNIYNRGALPEFFATALLTAAISIWFLLLREDDKRNIGQLANLFVLSFTLAAGTHPITALYGLAFIILTLPITLICRAARLPGAMLKALVLPACLGIICLSPWVLATAQHNKHLGISESFHRVGYFSRSLDSPFARLTPFPIPWRGYQHRLQDDRVKTPYLDTQINVPLVLLYLCLIALFARARRLDKRAAAVTVFLLCLGAWITYMSVTIHSMDRLGFVARSIQFAYRTITYINLSALVGIYMLFLSWRKVDTKIPTPTIPRWFASALLALSFTGLCVKLVHAEKIVKQLPPVILASQRSDQELLTLPQTFYGFASYTTPALAKVASTGIKLVHDVELKPSGGKHFGEMNTPEIRDAMSGWTVTNIQLAPWNNLWLGNRKVGYDEMATKDSRIVLANWPAGQWSYTFSPDPLWARRNAVAIPLFFAWLLGTACIAIAGLLKQRGDTTGGAAMQLDPEPRLTVV